MKTVYNMILSASLLLPTLGFAKSECKMDGPESRAIIIATHYDDDSYLTLMKPLPGKPLSYNYNTYVKAKGNSDVYVEEYSSTGELKGLPKAFQFKRIGNKASLRLSVKVYPMTCKPSL